MLFNRHFVLVSLLGSAVAVPYVSTSEQAQKIWGGLTATGSHESGAETGQEANSTTSPHSASSSVPPTAMSSEKSRHDAHASSGPSPTHVEGNAQHTLEEVLRFDVTPPWIIQSWPRVSTGLSELDLQGYRVALVTGISDSDLAGSLTYYFDKKNQVDRVIFHGTSGDPGRLVALVAGRYELKKQKSDDPSLTLFQRKSWGKTVSELRIRPAAVLRSESPHARYEIELALKRP